MYIDSDSRLFSCDIITKGYTIIYNKHTYTMYIVHCIFYTVQCTMFSVQCTMYTLHPISYHIYSGEARNIDIIMYTYTYIYIYI